MIGLKETTYDGNILHSTLYSSAIKILEGN